MVLLQELERWNKLVLNMESSLQQLRKALAGEIGMSKELDDLATSLFNGQLPAFWRKLTSQVRQPILSDLIHDYSLNSSEYTAQMNNQHLVHQLPKMAWKIRRDEHLQISGLRTVPHFPNTAISMDRNEQRPRLIRSLWILLMALYIAD